jgi:hypothetical protein
MLNISRPFIGGLCGLNHLFGYPEHSCYIYIMENKKLIKVELTIQEIWAASKTKIVRNRKKYSRKSKYKNVWPC